VSERKREVACPTCGKRAAFTAENPHRPFCSERCRVADLGGWASESYRVPGKPAEGDDDAAGGA
jgi:uncharacterized protein